MCKSGCFGSVTGLYDCVIELFVTCLFGGFCCFFLFFDFLSVLSCGLSLIVRCDGILFDFSL
jgi:hypothetical protein